MYQFNESGQAMDGNEAGSSAQQRLIARDGLCASARPSADDDPWFPAGGNPGYVLSEEQQLVLEVSATRACAGCPVMTQCADWALATGQEYGVWGGLAAHELRTIRQQSARRGSVAA